MKMVEKYADNQSLLSGPKPSPGTRRQHLSEAAEAAVDMIAEAIMVIDVIGDRAVARLDHALAQGQDHVPDRMDANAPVNTTDTATIQIAGPDRTRAHVPALVLVLDHAVVVTEDEAMVATKPPPVDEIDPEPGHDLDLDPSRETEGVAIRGDRCLRIDRPRVN